MAASLPFENRIFDPAELLPREELRTLAGTGRVIEVSVEEEV